MTTAAVVPVVSLAEWDAHHAGDERGLEIVEGILTVAPGEYSTNIAAVWNVGSRIEDTTRRAFRCLPNLDVLVRADPAAPTVRRPDAVIVAAGLPRTNRARPDQIALVVEAVSETSSERDWLTKRAEYAAAGIPAYLVLDCRPGSERIVLFETGTDGRYVEAPGDGSSVTLTLGGNDLVLSLADVLE